MPPATDRALQPGERQPFTARFDLVSVQLLASGDVFTHRSTEVQALDAQGRSYEGGECAATFPTIGAFLPFVSGRVCDPVGNTQTVWNSQDRRTVMLTMPPANQRHGCWQSDAGDFTINFGAAALARSLASRPSDSSITGNRPDVPLPSVEYLGKTDFQGVEAIGYRSTWPPLSNGAPDPPYLTEEHWVATSIGIWVSQEVDYPRMLNRTLKWSRELANLDVADADPALFRPPRRYAVTTENMHEVSCAPKAGSQPARVPRLH